jgi:hypothetical protein
MAERINQQPLADHLAAQREGEQAGPIGRNDLLSRRQRGREQQRGAARAGEKQQRQWLKLAARSLHQDQVKSVEQTGQHREQVAAQVGGR